MSETNRRYLAAIEHDDRVAEHARLIEVMGWTKERADEAVWGIFTEAHKAELAAQRQAELDRSGEWAAITNAVANDYNELTRFSAGVAEDAAAERRRREMEW